MDRVKIQTNNTNTHISGSWLPIVRAVWLALVVPSVGLFVVGLPVYYQQLQRSQTCGIGSCLNGGFTAQDLQNLVSHGFSMSIYAALLTIFCAIIAAIWCVVGFLLFWHRSDDWLALLAAFALVMIGITLNANSLFALELVYPAFEIPFGLVNFFAQVSLSSLLLLFPSGRLVPRWTGLVLLLEIIHIFLDNFPSPKTPFSNNLPDWTFFISFIFYGFIIISQIYRYRRVSTPVQRQQTKWVVFGTTIWLATFIGLILLSSIPSLNSNVFLLGNVWTITLPIVSLAVPLSISFSISRYRLYDIDALINHTLVYSALTISLALIYLGLVFGGQALLARFIGHNGGIVVVASTLIVVVLFAPLRKSIQNEIDRRFYRQKYDAQRTLQELSKTLSQEVEMERLCEHIVGVVQETMQPARISLWLCSPEPPESQEGL